MALLDAGYFPTTYFPSSYWQTNPQYWAEYGAVAPAAHTIRGAMRPTRIRRRRRIIRKVGLLDDPELLNLLVTFIELD